MALIHIRRCLIFESWQPSVKDERKCRYRIWRPTLLAIPSCVPAVSAILFIFASAGIAAKVAVGERWSARSAWPQNISEPPPTASATSLFGPPPGCRRSTVRGGLGSVLGPGVLGYPASGSNIGAVSGSPIVKHVRTPSQEHRLYSRLFGFDINLTKL